MTVDSAGCKLLFSDAITNESAGILLRSRLSSVARRLGFADARRENMLLVASELVTNLIKHAQGRGVIQIWQQPGDVLDLVSFDYGPGVEDLAAARRDGFSTKGTLGKGLGSLERLSDRFGIFSLRQKPGDSRGWHGTTVWCRFQAKAAVPARGCESGLFVRSLANDRHNGDHIYLALGEERIRLLHLDGLGHGAEAEQATAHLLRHVTEAEDLSGLMNRLDRHLRATTRGAVAVACDIFPGSGHLSMLGVGDMATHVCSQGQIEHFSFAPGVLGREHKTPRLTDLTVHRGDLVISTSDGIRRGWSEEAFPGLCQQHPQLVAYVLGNAMARITDDQSVCVLRIH